MLSAYQEGELTVDIPDLVQAVIERLSADGGASERGCRVTVKALLDQAGANAGGPARVHAYGHPTGAALPGRGVGEAELS